MEVKAPTWDAASSTIFYLIARVLRDRIRHTVQVAMRRGRVVAHHLLDVQAVARRAAFARVRAERPRGSHKSYERRLALRLLPQVLQSLRYEG